MRSDLEYATAPRLSITMVILRIAHVESRQAKAEQGSRNRDTERGVRVLPARQELPNGKSEKMQATQGKGVEEDSRGRLERPSRLE